MSADLGYCVEGWGEWRGGAGRYVSYQTGRDQVLGDVQPQALEGLEGFEDESAVGAGRPLSEDLAYRDI